MKIFIVALALIFAAYWSAFNDVKSAEQNQQHLYQVSLLRAAPSYLPSLIERVKADRKALGNELLIMRHSQGDHWDLMLLAPASKELTTHANYGDFVDFQHNFIASSKVSWKKLRQSSDNANLFHIEMFQAARGSYDKLLEQRHMENDYLVATKRNANYIFVTTFGSDVDMFTLGIYSDMQAFAAEPDLPEEVFEKAAVDAGFKARSDIGFYLREFLVGHQDTLATQVK